MSIFSILFPQTRAAVPQSPANSTPTAIPTPSPAAPAPSAAAVSQSSSSNWRFVSEAEMGITFRNLSNSHEDPSTGWVARFCAGARYPISTRTSFTPALCYSHESLGGLQEATIGSVTARALFNFRAYNLLNLYGGLQLGASHLGATANQNGTTGLIYGNNALAYSANNWALLTALNLGAQVRVINNSHLQMYIGLDYSLGHNSWSLTPDAIDRSPNDPPIPVNSVFHQLTAGLTLSYGSHEANLAPVAAEDAHAAVVQNAPSAVEAAPSSSSEASASSPNPLPSGPTITPPVALAPTAQPTTTPVNVSYADPITFSLSTRSRNAGHNNQAIARYMNAADINVDLLPHNTWVSFEISYSNPRQASVRLSAIGQNEGNGAIRSWRSPFTSTPPPPLNAQQIHALIENLQRAGLPRHARTPHSNFIYLTMSRDANNLITLNSY